ncbi:hypothetical protein A2483_04545 [Candidatus Peregrinibacteria bacterium RIFOXYC2_FULL_33_13]|nr:MAG: hypothetical protein UR27_C0007G0077 [Candidatus Peregrinibacteria bacterium GW2011_GWA2_33_10]KKP40862.1 MAG: hypothetical protein UR30_C0003G0034 [Candidatus Peregrinibacteria bacterium GW2011_GWC2_33_13]OGJ48556.1 MAG: hypothetical protein A2229_02100 [Candidatus Peregrinibacteria bacterium RIFOXYA2_FULL_33_7]OGJ52310.1 MAG: hypothetical protein A2483_04545 [Candidatus Peregrinibacteria bacterium RIFOXYC2_FULL_33_13]
MSQLSLNLTLTIILTITGCISSETPTQKNPGNNPNQTTELQGSFESIKGVMKPLSCYCYNSGYLTTGNKEKIPVCFEDKELDISCDQISIIGTYKTKKITPNPTSNSCPPGEMSIFYVMNYTCE